MSVAYLAVSAPIIGEVVRKWHSNWYVTGDDAVHAIHAHDVFTRNSPLVGMYSGISNGRPFVYHLGPMVFWALAIPERVFSERLGVVIGAAIVNVVASVAILRSVRRGFGEVPALAVGGMVALTFWSVGHATLAEPWNPFIGLVPLMAVMAYAVELASGSLASLPWIALAASFVVQSHYIYIPVVACAAIAGLVCGVLARRARAERGTVPGERRAIVAAALVTVACWSPAIIDQIVHNPGNLRAWYDAVGRSSGGDNLVLGDALHYAVRAVGWVPLAARGPLPDSGLLALGAYPGRLSAVVAMLVVVWLAWVVVRGWQRDPRGPRLAIVALATLGGLVFALTRMPAGFPTIPTYRVAMLWPVSAVVLCAAAGGAVLMLRATSGTRWGRFGVVGLSIVSLLASTAAVVGASPDGPVSESGAVATRVLVDKMLPTLPHARTYTIRGSGVGGYFAMYGVMRSLIDHGYRVFVDYSDVQLSLHHASDDHGNDVLLVESGVAALPAGGRLVARFDESTPRDLADLRRARAASDRALRAEPLRLTARGERERRGSSGVRRAAFDDVVAQKVTSDALYDADLAGEVYNSRADPDASRELFIVGPSIVPSLNVFANLRFGIEESQFRVVLIPSHARAS